MLQREAESRSRALGRACAWRPRGARQRSFARARSAPRFGPLVVLLLCLLCRLMPHRRRRGAPAQPEQPGGGLGLSRGDEKAPPDERAPPPHPPPAPPAAARRLGPPTLTKPGYWVRPSIEALGSLDDTQLSAVRGFAVGCPLGSVEWEGAVDVRGLDLDAVVVFSPHSARL